MTRLFINGQLVEFDENIEITRQVMDIFDISTRAADYTKTIKVLKTSHNKEIFDGLGFINTKFPYKRNYADLYENEVLIMHNAYVVFDNTGEKYYTLALISESAEIWKIVGNDTLSILDLKDTNHTKTAPLIKDLWNAGITGATKYMYFVADYGGKLPVNNTVAGQYLIPSYRISYLLSKIEDYYKIKINLPENALQNGFVTYGDSKNFAGVNDDIVLDKIIDTPNTFDIFVHQYIAESDGKYKIILNTILSSISIAMIFVNDKKFKFFASTNACENRDKFYSIYKIVISDEDCNGNTISYTSDTIILNKGDKILIKCLQLKGDVKIVKLGSTIETNQSFTGFKIYDFIKELIYQTASIPIKRNKENIYDFITLKQIAENQPVDWSPFFEEKVSEKYIINHYGQNNYFKYKYNDKDDNNKDGYFKIDNENIKNDAEIIKSNLHGTPLNTSAITLSGAGIRLPQFPFWDRKVEDKNGILKETYTPLSNRMYLISGESYNTGPFNIEVSGETIETTKFIAANTKSIQQFDFQTIIKNNYQEFVSILQNIKVVNAKLNIPLIELVNFDFKRRIYINQLASYFIVNRIEYKYGQLQNIELLEANELTVKEVTDFVIMFLEGDPFEKIIYFTIQFAGNYDPFLCFINMRDIYNLLGSDLDKIEQIKISLNDELYDFTTYNSNLIGGAFIENDGKNYQEYNIYMQLYTTDGKIFTSNTIKLKGIMEMPPIIG